MSPRLWLAAIWSAAVLGISPVALAAPTVTSVSPRGLQIGQPTTVVIAGSDLSADIRLVSEAKIAKQIVKAGAKADRIELEITLDASALPGLYAFRVADGGGISSPVVLGIDRLPQRAVSDKTLDLQAAYSGTVGGAQVLQSKLQGKKDQRLIIDVEAQRLGSGLKPVVRLDDARGTQIAWSPPRAVIGGDARIETTLPADGEYTLELHDELFRPTGPGFFRLTLGDLQYADLAFPLGVTAGEKETIRYASSNVEATAQLNAVELAVPGETTAPVVAAERLTGAAPRVSVSDFPELIESTEDLAAGLGPRSSVSKGIQELPAAPSAVSGRLSSAGEEDKYLLTVKPGQKLRFDVSARQFGSPLDGVLTIRKESGEQLATGDDRPGSSDPLVDFTVPAGVTKVQVAIKDLLGRGGSDFVYRIVVRDQARPDFSLTLTTDKINVPAGGTQVIPVQVIRSNYNGPIELALSDQPSEVSLLGNVIPAGATIGLLTLSAQDVSPTADLTRIVGRAADIQARSASEGHTTTSHPLVRAAQSPDVLGSKYQPRIKTELGLAITRHSPISLAWIPGDDDRLYLGGKLPARVHFTRAEGAKGKVRLKLLTSQPTPKKTIKENNQDKVVDDIDRALRLEGDPTFGPDKMDVTANILVPSDLPRQPWDLVLVAELLSADGKSVVSSLAAPVRTLSPIAPISLALTSENKAEGVAGKGSAGKLVGKITRSPGYAQPVVVTLDGLPKGIAAPKALVAPDKSEFELPLTFPYNTKPGDLKNAKLVAVSSPVVVTSVKSNAIDIAVKISAGEKPDTEEPKEVFEDDEKFIALLTEGNGRAIPDQRQAFSGKYSLRVTPDQKFNAKLPNLGIKIRENPGPGEYRYLQFAWQKAQGNTICLQLAHDGKFGPAKGSGREGAKFRYHAGTSDEPFGASLQIADKIPAKFEVVTRDLFLDFGEFTFTGLAFSPVDGQAALFDHIYLARQPDDFESIKVEKK
jgi:hypothetical protein